MRCQLGQGGVLGCVSNRGVGMGRAIRALLTFTKAGLEVVREGGCAVLCCAERWTELGVLILEERRVKGHTVTVQKYLRGS